jgi:cell division protein FtsA
VLDAETSVNTSGRRGMSNFWGKFKNSLIDMFREEEDHKL